MADICVNMFACAYHATQNWLIVFVAISNIALYMISVRTLETWSLETFVILEREVQFSRKRE